jgi:hypothetical protein
MSINLKNKNKNTNLFNKIITDMSNNLNNTSKNITISHYIPSSINIIRKIEEKNNIKKYDFNINNIKYDW